MATLKKLTAAAVCAALLPLTACISSKPPVAVSKSTYSQIQEDEHQTLSPTIKYLTLNMAQDIALQNNPTFRAKYFAIVAARAQYYSAFTYYLPTVTAGYSLTGAHNDYLKSGIGNNGTVTTSMPSLSVDLTVFDSFVREMNVLAQKHNWKQTEEAEQDARRQLLRDVAYAYNNVLLASSRIRIAVANMKFQRDLLKETELKFEVGTSPLSDVLNFKTKYNTAESSLYAAQYTYVVSKYALAELMGLTEGNIPSTVKFPETASPDGEMLNDVNTYLDAALANRPDLKQVREQYEMSKYSYYSKMAAFGPKVSFNFTMKYNDIHSRDNVEDTAFRYQRADYSYGLNVSWDLFQGGRRFLALRQAEANLVQADYASAAVWIGVVKEVRTAYDNYITCLKQVKLNQKNLEIVRKMRDLVNEEYLAGSKGITRLNEAQNDLVSAENELASAVVSLHNAKAQLEAATNSI